MDTFGYGAWVKILCSGTIPLANSMVKIIKLLRDNAGLERMLEVMKTLMESLVLEWKKKQGIFTETGCFDVFQAGLRNEVKFTSAIQLGIKS